MDKTTQSVFFHKISEKINNGDYDQHMTIPFMSRSTLIAAIKQRLSKKIEKNMTPILTDQEVLMCVTTAKELAATMFAMYVKLGFIERTEEGFDVTERGKLAVKQGVMDMIFNDLT